MEKLDRLAISKEQIPARDSLDGLEEELLELRDTAHHLLEAEKHHRREDKALFPRVEKRGITGPPQMMKDHIYKENNILYLAAVEVIQDEEWEEVREESGKISYCPFTPDQGPDRPR